VEHFLHVRLQRQHRRGLCHPIRHVGNAQDPGPAFLRDLHRPDRPREITTRGHTIPQFVQVAFQPGLELFDRHPVSPSRSTILFHFQPRIPDQLLRDVMRLAFPPRLTHATHSLQVGLMHQPEQPRPLAPPALPGFTATTGESASVPLHRYSAPHSFCCLEFSLSPPTPVGVCSEATPSHVPYERLVRAHAAYTPDTAWAVNRYPPDLSQSTDATLVSMSPKLFSTRRRQIFTTIFPDLT
jgi:hypothetical protein